MALDEGTTGKKRRGPRFKDLSKATQAQRINRAEEAGRLSSEKAEAARRHWNLAPGSEQQMATAWAAKNAAFVPGEVRKPTRVPSQREQDIDEHTSLIQRGRGVTKPRFVAPPPPPKLTDHRVKMAAQANWALRAPVDLPGRGARRQLARTATEQEVRDIYEGRKPPVGMTAEERKAWAKVREISKGRNFMDRLPRTVVDAVFSEEEQQQLRETNQAAMQTAMHGGEIIGRPIGRRVGKIAATELQKAGLVEGGTAAAIAETAENLFVHLSQGAIGLGPGAFEMATDPNAAVEGMAEQYKQFYGPAVKGDWDAFRKNIKANPEMFLDWLAVFGAGMGVASRAGLARQAFVRAPELGASRPLAAARALATNKTIADIRQVQKVDGNVEAVDVPAWRKMMPGERYHVTGEGEPTKTRRYQPGSPAGRVIANAYDAWLRSVAKHPMAPGRAARYALERRRRKGIRERDEAVIGRQVAEIEGFKAATRGMQAPERMALDRMLRRGGEPAEVMADLETEIQNRAARGANQTPAELNELADLQAAKSYLANPDSNFLELVGRGRAISRATEDSLKELGLLNETTAERMLLQYAQYLEPDVVIDTPSRDRFIEAMQEVGYKEDEIRLAMQYYDVNAASHARRLGVDPEDFYSDLYSDVRAVDTEDLNEMFVGMDDPDFDPELLAQRGDELPYGVSRDRDWVAEAEAAHARLTSEDPAVRAAAWKEAEPKGRNPGAQNVTVRDKIMRVFRRVPDKDQRAEFARWYKDLWPTFEAEFGERAAAAIRGFAISQSAMSPADGVMALLKVLEYQHEHGVWPAKGKLSHNTREIVRAWNDELGLDPEGVGRKIDDFFRSIYGVETRAWLQDYPLSAPGVVDRWTVRSDGYVDRKTYAHLTNQGVDAPNPAVLEGINKELKALKDKRDAEGELSPDELARLQELKGLRQEQNALLNEFYDMSGAPNPLQYGASSIRLNQMRDEMNGWVNDDGTVGFDGRTDWAIDEVQALDWFATRTEWGEINGGHGDTWSRNTYDVVGDIIGEQEVIDWLQEGAAAAIVKSATWAGSHARVTLRATPTQAVRMAERLANETGQRSYTFYTHGIGVVRRKTPAGKDKTLQRVHGLDLDVRTPEAFEQVKADIKALNDSDLLVLPFGDGTVRVMFTNHEGRAAKSPERTAKGKDKNMTRAEAEQLRDWLATTLEERGVTVRPVNAIMEVIDGAKRPHRDLYRGHDPTGVLSRAAAKRRRRSGFHVRAVAGRAGAERFVDGLNRNTRAWSLAPRATEDFLEKGYKGFLTRDGNAGAAVSPDGEIVSVFNSKSFPGAGSHVLVEALANGGYWLNAYDGFLPARYASLGFREVGRMPFDDTMAPAGWDYRHGRPDIVFMAYAPDLPIKRTTRYYRDWGAAERKAKQVGAEARGRKDVDEWLNEMADRADKQVHIAQDGTPLAQWKRTAKFEVREGEGYAKAAVIITDKGVELVITPASTFSSLIHENAHAFLRGGLEWLRQGNDPRLEKIMNYLGITEIDDLLDVRKTRDAHELFAEAVEVGLFLGRIPAPQMRRLMQDTKSKLRAEYKGGIGQIVSGEGPAKALRKKKIIAMLNDNDFGSFIDDMHNAAFGVERRRDAVFIPTIRAVDPSMWQRTIGRVTRQAPTPVRKSPVRKGSTGVLWESGEYEPGALAVAKYATATVRFRVAAEKAREIFEGPDALKLQLDEAGNLVPPPPGHRLFVYGKAPRSQQMVEERLGLQARGVRRELEDGEEVPEGEDTHNYDQEPQEEIEEIFNAINDEFEKEMSPSLAEIQRTQGRLEDYIENDLIRWIPETTWNAYVDGQAAVTALSIGSKAAAREIGAFAMTALTAGELLNAAQRWVMVMKGAYPVANAIGSAGTATMHNPFWIFELRKAMNILSNCPPELLRAIDEGVGMGTYDVVKMLDEGAGYLQKFSAKEHAAYRKTAEVLTLPERRIRRALAIRELHANGYDTKEKMSSFLERTKIDEAAAAEWDQIMRWAEDGVVRFRGANAVEQTIIRRFMIVYGWQRAAFRYTMRFPLEHPVMAGVMNAIGQEGWDYLQEAIEKQTNGQQIGLRGGIPLGVKGTGAAKMMRFSDLSSVFPMGSGLETLRNLTGAPISLINEFAGRESVEIGSVSEMLSQGAAFGLSMVYGETPRGLSLSEWLSRTYGQAKGFSGIPLLNWGMRFNDPNVTETTTLGPYNDRWDVLGAFALGQLWPRDTKLEPAVEVYRKQLPKEIRIPQEEQQEYDKLLNRYAAAVNKFGGVQHQEWMRAANARAAYNVASGLKSGDWDDLPSKQRDLEYAKLRKKALAKFYPAIGTRLDALNKMQGMTEDRMVEEINSMYDTYISSEITDMKAYIAKVSGPQAVEDLN